MIASVQVLTEFLKKHKNKKSPGLWSMSHRKAVVVKNLNDKIYNGKYHFSERVNRIVDGRKMTFYKEWEDRFIDFCLYRYLMRLAFQKNLVSPNYMSCRGRGRFHAVRCLFEQKNKFKYIFKTDVKSYFHSINNTILEKIIYSSGIPNPLHHLIWQDLFLKDIPFVSPSVGIFQGSSISSYYAWIYLKNLDDFFNKENQSFYQRYKDDIIVLTKSSGNLNKTRDTTYSILRKRDLKSRYKKTFAGKTSAPISYLGFCIRKNQIGQSLESKKKGSAFVPVTPLD